MPHRRKGRRPSLARIRPEDRALILGLSRAPRWLITRSARARSQAAVIALLDPRRRMSKGCLWGGGR
jgi:hypothetical protein